jgi:hypothetical protein
MRAFSNAEFLSLWEDGRPLHSLDRGLLAIRALGSGPGAGNAADWPLGHRNLALAQLHRDCFGPQLQGWTECSRCGEKLEFQLDCLSLIERQLHVSNEPVVVNGCAFRAPTSRDLARIAGERDPESAASLLIEACRLPIGVEESSSPDWSPIDLEELNAKMTEADPLSEILLSFECPVCRTAREQALDLPEFIWAELEAFAKRLLYEIHVLASAYGWSEDRILALSDSRRALYLQMVQA